MKMSNEEIASFGQHFNANRTNEEQFDEIFTFGKINYYRNKIMSKKHLHGSN